MNRKDTTPRATLKRNGQPDGTLARALAVRDCALRLLKEHGEWIDLKGLRLRKWQGGGFIMALRPPLKIPPVNGVSGLDSYSKVLVNLRAAANAPNHLDVWEGTKVLSLDWSGDGVRIGTFVQSDWDARLIAMGL